MQRFDLAWHRYTINSAQTARGRHMTTRTAQQKTLVSNASVFLPGKRKRKKKSVIAFLVALRYFSSPVVVCGGGEEGGGAEHPLPGVHLLPQLFA